MSALTNTSPLRRRITLLSAGMVIFLVYLWGEYSGVLAGNALNYWSDFFWTLFALVAGIRCLRTARKSRSRQTRRAWNLFGMAALSWFLGMLVWDYHELFTRTLLPFPGTSDWLYMGYAVFFAAGLFQYRTDREIREYKFIQLANLGLIICGVLFLCHLILAEPMRLSDNSYTYELYALLHSQLTVFCFLFGSYCYLFFTWEENKLSFQLLLSSLLVMSVTDTLYAFQLLGQTYEATSYLNLYWLITFFLQYWAAVEHEHSQTGQKNTSPQPNNGLEKAEATMPAFFIVSILIAYLIFPQPDTPETRYFLLANGLIFAFFLAMRGWFTSQLENELRKHLLQDIAMREKTEEQLRWEVRLNTELATISNTLIAPIDKLEDVSTLILDSARLLTRSPHGFVSEIDPLTSFNVVQTVTKMMDDSLVVGDPDQKLAFKPGPGGHFSGLLGQTLNSGEAFFSNTADKHPNALGVPEGHITVTRFLSVPVKYDQQTIGQIALANPEQDYTRQDLEAIERLAELFAIAIHRKRTNDENKKLTATAIRSSQLATLGELSAGVAHEINNPINGVINYAQIITIKSSQDPSLAELGTKIIREGERISTIVKRLLSFSRKEEGVRNCHPVRNLLQVPLALSGKSLLHDGISITTAIDGEPKILCNEQEIEQVFLNLLSNAQYALNKKYPQSCKEKVIEISAWTHETSQGGFALISFKDHGVGIPKDTLPKIFETFYTSKELGAGTGLGLSIIENILKNHQGQIRIQSEEGLYTEVLIELPLHQ